jgi:hypothetical protein
MPMLVPSANSTSSSRLFRGGAVEHLAAGDGGEQVGEICGERGVLQDVEQVDRAPPALDLGLERAQVPRLGELVIRTPPLVPLARAASSLT